MPMNGYCYRQFWQNGKIFDELYGKCLVVTEIPAGCEGNDFDLYTESMPPTT
jgi:hypothetical protein